MHRHLVLEDSSVDIMDVVVPRALTIGKSVPLRGFTSLKKTVIVFLIRVATKTAFVMTEVVCVQVHCRTVAWVVNVDALSALSASEGQSGRLFTSVDQRSSQPGVDT